MRKEIFNALIIVLVGGSLITTGVSQAQQTSLPNQPVPLPPSSSGTSGSAGATAIPPAGPSAPSLPVTPSPEMVGPPSLSGSITPPPPLTPPPPPGYWLVPAPVAVPPPVRAYEPIGAWFNVEYLLWWTKDSRIPPLVNGEVPSGVTALGPASSQALFGGGNMAEGAQSGGRFTLGGWLTPNKAIGLEGSYFFLGNHSFPIAYGQEDSSPAGSPPGTYSSYQSSSLQGAEVNLLSNFYHSSRFNLDILGGFRYLRLNESLWVEQDFNSADYSEEDTWNDEFHTCNQFYGGQIGASSAATPMTGSLWICAARWPWESPIRKCP